LRILAAISMALAILAATIGFAGPVSAAPVEWVMPNVTNMVLRPAIKAIREVTAPAELKIRLQDRRNNQEPHNEANWKVCYQSPSAGKEISQKTKTVTLVVMRFNQKSCWK